MADQKISQLAAASTIHTDDLLIDVDVHDVSMATTGTDKKVTFGQLTAAFTGDVTFVGFAGTIGSGVVTESKMALADLTALNVSTVRHGFAPKAPGSATQYLDGTGNYSTPAATVPPVGITLNQVDQAIGSPADAPTINFDTSAFSLFCPAALGGNRALTLSNVPSATPFARPFIVVLLQGATGSRTITSWFAGFTILWAGGSPPTLTTTPGKRDAFVFVQISAATFLGSVAGQNY